MIRVRFAPSPTGHLHIGGVRTALFNYLYARNQNGKFLLRIEDTDRQRSETRYEKEILSSLDWLGLNSDEALIRQSVRIEKYKAAAEELVKKDLAYKEGQVAIKFKMPKKKAVFEDMVHGRVEFDASLFEDLVLIKSDGFPTYHWACVLDDHDMEITHVIRGDDHLSNTPRQILLYEAIGCKPPKFGHLPLILGDDGTPLSKRHGAVALQQYREEGFLPEGLLNYLALLGWGESGNQEIYSLEELIKKFSIKRINKANARFNREKLEWINAQHIKKLSEIDYLRQISVYCEKESKRFSPEHWQKLAMLYRSRIKTFSDLKVQAVYCFENLDNYDQDLAQSFIGNRPLKKHLEVWLENARELKNFEEPDKVEAMTRETAAGWGIEAKDLIHPLRFAMTGKTVSPGLFELMTVLGKEVCVNRLEKFLQIPKKG